jgi:hypothetical protein
MARWLSKPAVLWAMDDAPDVPAHLFGALMAVARYAGEDGRGAHPSAMTVAAIIRKTERAAKKDLAELRRRGLLLSGDQRIVKDIRADKRPFVYDLPMPRGEPQDTPSSGHGVNHRVKRGEPQGRSGVNHRTPKEILNRSRRSARSAASADAAPHAQPQTPPPAEAGAEPAVPLSAEELEKRAENIRQAQEQLHAIVGRAGSRRYGDPQPIAKIVGPGDGAASNGETGISDDQAAADRKALFRLTSDQQARLIAAAVEQLPADATTREVHHAAVQLAQAGTP